MAKLIESGAIQRELMQQCYDRMTKIEQGKIPIVGVNIFRQEEAELKVPIFRASPGFQEKRIAEVNEMKKARDNQKVKKALDQVRRMAEKEESEENNMMPCIREAVECYATNGEICGALADVWGEYETPPMIFK
jgi:methylmalonyl-CoA mutase N-terminal domain/subunit